MNNSNSAINMIYTFIEFNDKLQKPFINSGYCLIFVVLAAFGFNMFWRKSFVFSRDFQLVLLSEIIAITIIKAAHTGFVTWHQLFLMGAIALCIYPGIAWVYSGSTMKRPRNRLDSQDIINFFFTAATISILVRHNCIASAHVKFDEKLGDMTKLWASIPILSLFQITRWVLYFTLAYIVHLASKIKYVLDIEWIRLMAFSLTLCYIFSVILLV